MIWWHVWRLDGPYRRGDLLVCVLADSAEAARYLAAELTLAPGLGFMLYAEPVGDDT